MIDKNCKSCNKIFKPREKSTKYCSRKCAHISATKFSICPICKKYFHSKRHIFCSQVCYREGIKIHKPKPCKICGKEFLSKSYSSKYCSRKCAGIEHSKFMKSPRMIKILSNRKMIAWNKGKNIQSNTGRTHFKKGDKRPLGSNHHSWKGGRFLNCNGYITKYIPPNNNGQKGKHILEHRYVMEQKIGRKLLPNEIIHHNNGIKTDNRPENLEIVLRKTHFGNVTCPHCLKEFLIK